MVLQRQIDPFDASIRAVQLKTIISFLPWVANGLVLISVLVFRWYIGTGYLISFAGLMLAGTGIGLIGLVAFFATTPLLALTDWTGVIVFLGLLVTLGLWFLWKMFGILRKWWTV